MNIYIYSMCSYTVVPLFSHDVVQGEDEKFCGRRGFVGRAPRAGTRVSRGDTTCTFLSWCETLSQLRSATSRTNWPILMSAKCHFIIKACLLYGSGWRGPFFTAWHYTSSTLGVNYFHKGRHGKGFHSAFYVSTNVRFVANAY